MKKALVVTLAIGCLSVPSLFAQGKVSFNLSSLNPVPLVTNGVTGAGLNNAYRAQLFYGSSADSSTFAPVWSTLAGAVSTPFTFGVIPGVVNDNTAKYTDPTRVEGGTPGYFQVRAWTAAMGATYDAAFAAWNSQAADPSRLLGQSVVVKVNVLASGTASPPATPSPLVGMQGFGVAPVPEPSVIALGALGLAALLYRRRK